jgi:hypothetical protein
LIQIDFLVKMAADTVHYTFDIHLTTVEESFLASMPETVSQLITFITIIDKSDHNSLHKGDDDGHRSPH